MDSSIQNILTQLQHNQDGTLNGGYQSVSNGRIRQIIPDPANPNYLPVIYDVINDKCPHTTNNSCSNVHCDDSTNSTCSNGCLSVTTNSQKGNNQSY